MGKALIGLALMISLPQLTRASDGKPHLHLSMATVKIYMAGDTLVPKPVPEQKSNSKPVESIIKEVPKARRQAVPVAINVKVPVKPIITIKPKIIKPVIRILH